MDFSECMNAWHCLCIQGIILELCRVIFLLSSVHVKQLKMQTNNKRGAFRTYWELRKFLLNNWLRVNE